MNVPADVGRPWRILYAGTCPPHQGGSAVSSWLVLRHLALRGHRVRMVVPTTSRKSNLSLPGPIPPTIEVDPFWMPFYDINPFGPTPTAYLSRQRQQVRDRLQTALARERWDLILAGRESFIQGLPDIARDHRVPCASFVRGAMLPALAGAHPDQQFAATMLNEARQMDLLVPVAEHLGLMLEEAGYDNVRAVANGVDVDQFRPARGSRDLCREVGLPNTARIIVHISNFKPVKRIDRIVDAARRLIAGDRDIFLLLVGDGPEKGNILDRCAKVGIVGNVVSSDWVANGDVSDYLNLSDIAVLASETEVMPRFVLEAMACGRPVVANDIPANRELVDHGKDGLIYPDGDIDRLAVSMSALLRDSERRSRMGQAARRRMVRDFDIHAIVDRFEAAVVQALVRHRQSMQVPH